MKSTFIIIGFFLSFTSVGQSKHAIIKVIAQRISPGEGSKIYIAEYKVIKVINGLLTNDTILVGYSFYNEYHDEPDTVLLTLTTYTGNTKIDNYYTFPDYDAKKGIEQIQISTVDFKYWKNCETGKGKCNPLNFSRKSKYGHWFLFLPCGGTNTNVTLTADQSTKPIQKLTLLHPECPPVFDLTDLTNGKYFAFMLAYGLGGQIELNLIASPD